MDAERLGSLRVSLEAQRAELRRELTELGADPDSDELAFADDRGFADRSHSTEERSRLLSVSRSLRANLREVDAALEKMEAGTYGTCERCGNPIDPERLEAIPWAALCIECKRSEEP
jgi:DnaK suppressor protein